MYMNDEKLKKMPQAVEIEEFVLSALMTEGKAIERINLKADDFYLAKHQIIFTAIQRLQNRFSAIDMFTICEELNKMGELENIGGQYFVTCLAIKVASNVHLVSHSEIIKQKSIARKLINISGQIQDMSYDEQTDVSDVLEFFEKNIGQEEVYVLRTGHARVHALRAAAEGIRERLFPGQYGFFSDIALDDF